MRTAIFRVFGFIALCLASTAALATAPTIFGDPAHESPVRGDPDDLLLLPGDGFSTSDRVVYLQLTDTTSPLVAPAIGSVPATPTASIGFADVASTADVPNTLTAHLPAAMTAGVSYALWVVNAAGEWSNGVRINDARPLWITPDMAYQNASLANLPRTLKVVGRNLQPTPGGSTQVKLIGPTTYTLTAATVDVGLDRYAAQVTLPTGMTAGTYSVQVSRDAVSWVALLADNLSYPPYTSPPTAPLLFAQTLTVSADPAASDTVNVDETLCAADPNGDDTTCIVSAIQTAANTSSHPNGATVVFAARTYHLLDPGTWPTDVSSKGVDAEGIHVPWHVNLQGAGAGSTTINRGAGWITPIFAGGSTRPVYSIFNLQGYNTIQGITFGDDIQFTSGSNGGSALMLGIDSNYANAISLPNPFISHVVISQNEFKAPFQAITNGGLPTDHLYITGNTIAGAANGLNIEWNNNVLPIMQYHLADVVIAYNSFVPTSVGTTIASQIGGGTRMDFSNNTADGRVTTYLYNPSTDPKGFNAAFFWNLNDNSEMKLISQNTITCSGDKAVNNGEAVVFDNLPGLNFGGYLEPVPVATATSDAASSVLTVNSLPYVVTDPNARLPFVGQWLHVVQGQGVGQLRRITAYGSSGSTATFTVQPAFDVLPQSSLILLDLQNWQSYIVDNQIDHRPSVCVNPAKAGHDGGVLSFYTNTADSVIEGNTQLGTSGILIDTQFNPDDVHPVGMSLETSNEIRNNVITGEPVFGGVVGQAGVNVAYTASFNNGSGLVYGTVTPPVMNFGLAVAGNQLVQSDNQGGGIAFNDAGPVGTRNSLAGCVGYWDLVKSPLVFHNSLQESLGIGINALAPDQFPNKSPNPPCNTSLRDTVVWHTTTYANSCTNVTDPFIENGAVTKRVCPASPDGNSCECSVYVQGDAATGNGYSTSVSLPSAQTGGNVNVVAVGWNGSTVTVSAVADDLGNDYILAAGPTALSATGTQAIYYARIAGSGANTVTVNFSSGASNADVRVAEYSGLVLSGDPVDAVAAGTSSSTTTDSGWATTGYANDLIVAADYVRAGTTSAGTGFTSRLATARGNILEDRIVNAAQAYDATASLSTGALSIMQMVALKLAGSSTNAPIPTTPFGLAATAVSSSQVSLTWTGSTADIAIGQYLIERCQGSGCANFAQIGTASGTSYTDNSVAGSTQYSYRVRAADVAGVVSSYSTAASATTP